ncbi:MAG TPA: GtrA family protein [Ramlibacter sp.]
MAAPLLTPERGRIVRFLASGAVNTLLTYVLYLFLLPWLGAVWSYTLAYVAGIVLAYVLNRAFVFRAHAGWKSVAAMPLIYMAQYGMSIAVVSLSVRAGLRPEYAPLPAIALSLPVTYLLSRLAFRRRATDGATQSPSVEAK